MSALPTWSRRIATIGALACLGLFARGHTRLHNPSNQNPLFWSSPGNIGIVINSAGSADIPDGSHETSIRMAIDAWNDATGSSATLVEDTTTISQARTDFSGSDIHLILFDESNSSGYFPGGSGIVAITPVFFFGSGLIADADIIFNGSEFDFTTSGQFGDMDVQDVAAHELGHLLGLDHSGWAGGTMYPFVSPQVTLHRSLSSDEVTGIRSAYPATSISSLTGTILRSSDSSAVGGAYVVARDANGRTAGAILSAANGDFTITGLDAGTYTVYATPLDSPVDAANLTSGHTVQTNFEPALYPSPIAVGSGASAALGTLMVDADVSINLGIDGEALPMRAPSGTTTSLTLRGNSLTLGSTLTVSDPSLTLSAVAFFNSQVQFQVTVPAMSAAGHVDLAVTNATGDLAILPAAIEITPPDPVVSNVTPSSGTSLGGTSLSITGSGFLPGLRVIIGDQIYVEGAGGGATLVDSGTITLTTAATVGGTHDVVVMDSSGVEGRANNAFVAADVPVLSSVFPTVGSASGGTELVLSGSNFKAGAVVRINSVNQAAVTFDSSSRLLVTTNPGTAGGPFSLEVENPDSSIATSAFAFVAQADPTLTALLPASGSPAGGELITVSGSDFDANTQVQFGVNPDTGAGGTLASTVTLIDSNTLEVVTPVHGAGDVAVMVRNSVTGQVDVVSSSFSFAGPNSGGGGGCHLLPIYGSPPSAGDILKSNWWLAALFSVVAARGWLARKREREALSAPVDVN